MLLLITGSGDGTSDFLVRELGNKVFRLNFNLYKDYEFEFNLDYWRIKNPAGHEINASTVTSAFWWKAFNDYIVDEEAFIVEEVKYIFRELYNWCRLKGLVKGVPPDFHNLMGKINILSIAQKYFLVPRTLVTFRLAGTESFSQKDLVAKSFTSGLTTTNRALYTTKIQLNNLNPDYAWFLQELIPSHADVTIFICGNKFFAYSKDRSTLTGLDWRQEQSTGNLQHREWLMYQLSETEKASVSNFCLSLNVDWGRIDLLDTPEGLVFLEYNANGQFLFLDYELSDGLLKEVSTYIMHN